MKLEFTDLLLLFGHDELPRAISSDLGLWPLSQLKELPSVTSKGEVEVFRAQGWDEIKELVQSRRPLSRACSDHVSVHALVWSSGSIRE
jgi:hypothetical protein